MASYRRGHRRRVPLWAGYGWLDAPVEPEPVPQLDGEPTAAATAPTLPAVATAVEPADVEPKPSGE